MPEAIVFGGTTEGRLLCERCADLNLSILYCVATEEGAYPIRSLPHVDVRVGRLNAGQMAELLPAARLVVDATHPYAQIVSQNIAAACQVAQVPLLRIARDRAAEPGCRVFSSLDELLAELQKEPGDIFVTLGSSYATALQQLEDYRNRVWMRILPSLEGLQTCLESGYRPDRLICMQGPFSVELNQALFRRSKARILVTKDSGQAGGFSEKVQAAKGLGMQIAVLARPEEVAGVSLEKAIARLCELKA